MNILATLTLSLLFAYIFCCCIALLVVYMIKNYDKRSLENFNRKQLKKKK